MHELAHGADDFADAIEALAASEEGGGGFLAKEVEVDLAFGGGEGFAGVGRQGGAGTAMEGKEGVDVAKRLFKEVEIVADVLEGRVDFVGDSGGERAHGFHFESVAEFDFHAALLADVEAGDDELVVGFGGVEQDGETGLILCHEMGFKAESLAVVELREVGQQIAVVVEGEEGLQGGADELLAGDGEELLGATVGAEHGAVGSDDPDRGRDGGINAGEAPLGRLESLLGVREATRWVFSEGFEEGDRLGGSTHG